MITKYIGRPSRLENLAEEKENTIHDDATAIELGFQGAFIPGSIVASHAFPMILDHYGQNWFHAGWYWFKFISPVYTSSQIQYAGDAGSDSIKLRVEATDGRLCCLGEAGPGYHRPWELAPETSTDDGNYFTSTPVGTLVGEFPFSIDKTKGREILVAAADHSNWFKNNEPSSQAMVPPELLMSVALDEVHKHVFDTGGTRGPGMWTKHQLALRKAFFFDREYVMKEWVADKGIKGSTPFLEFEFTVTERGSLIAEGRHQSKWLPALS